MPHNARLCYISLKLIFKKFIKKKVPSALKSYHLLTLFFWFMELDRRVSSWENNSVEAFVTNLKALMLFVSHRLSIGDIPHYFISTVNLTAGLIAKEDEKTLSEVAKYIEDLVSRKEFPGKFISDQAVYHLMAFNPNKHLKIVESRESADDWVSCLEELSIDDKDNLAFSKDEDRQL